MEKMQRGNGFIFPLEHLLLLPPRHAAAALLPCAFISLLQEKFFIDLHASSVRLRAQVQISMSKPPPMLAALLDLLSDGEEKLVGDLDVLIVQKQSGRSVRRSRWCAP